MTQSEDTREDTWAPQWVGKILRELEEIISCKPIGGQLLRVERIDGLSTVYVACISKEQIQVEDVNVCRT